MQNLPLIVMATVLGLTSLNLHAQGELKDVKCFQYGLPDTTEVFRYMEIKPSFKGGDPSFLTYITQHISFSRIAKDMSSSERMYKDTATIKFIISRDGKMSNLTVKNKKMLVFQEEVIRIIRESSCLWYPGSFSGRYINGWMEIDIYFSVEWSKGELTTRVGFKEYDSPTD